ncbi:hypothetical protein Tco_1302915, partial [Tanacetum coccineum]
PAHHSCGSVTSFSAAQPTTYVGQIRAQSVHTRPKVIPGQENILLHASSVVTIQDHTIKDRDYSGSYYLYLLHASKARDHLAACF